MPNYETYDITPEEMEKIKEVGIEADPPKGYCGINDHKPSFCRQGPLVSTRMPGCGFYFVQDDDGKTERKGSCKNCGRCCAVPRKNGSEYGFFDVRGKPCIHLKVEEK